MMKVKLAAAVAVAALVAGCGGSTKVVTKTVQAKTPETTSTESTTPMTTSSTTSTTTASDSCTAKGIDTGANKTGRCVRSGHVFVVVNGNQTLKLPTLSAHVVAASAVPSVSSQYGGAAVAKGVFIVIKLTVTNRLNSPQEFGEPGNAQTLLVLNNRDYTEDFTAENGPDSSSCIEQGDNGDTQPDESETCDVIFDVPKSRVAAVDESGNLDIADFGSDFSDSSIHRIGVIRTYKPNMLH